MENISYYVNAVSGDDGNSGTCPQQALKSLYAVNRLTLNPGDQVLLARGSVFSHQYLHLHARGTAQAPITIGAYGQGDLPVIAAQGCGLWYQNYGQELDNPNHVWHGYVSSAVLLYDCEYICLWDLEISNDPGLLPGESYDQSDKMNRTGVAVVAQNQGTCHDITLTGLYVHDVKGNVYDKHLANGGIYCVCLKPEREDAAIPRYDGLTITHCRVFRCSRWGIAAGYTYAHAPFAGRYLDDAMVKTYGHTRVYIAGCFVKDIGGDGITPMYCYKPLIERNVSENIATEINDRIYTQAGARLGKTAAAIWPWKCKDALFQFNEAYHTCFNQDGQAWDADSGDGTIYQFNYSHNNGGGCVMFCLGESVNNIFRYNISFLDGDGTLSPAENPDAHIYGNTFLMAPGVPFIRHNMSGGHLLVENNLIACIGPEPGDGGWHHQTEFAQYKNNIYCNFAAPPQEDAGARMIADVRGILRNPLSGPRETQGIIHPREAFQGYIPTAQLENDPKEDPAQTDFLGNPSLEHQIGACRKA